MDGYACPKGHQSAEPDFCSDCGAKIQGATALPAKSNSGAPETGGATVHAAWMAANFAKFAATISIRELTARFRF